MLYTILPCWAARLLYAYLSDYMYQHCQQTQHPHLPQGVTSRKTFSPALSRLLGIVEAPPIISQQDGVYVTHVVYTENCNFKRWAQNITWWWHGHNLPTHSAHAPYPILPDCIARIDAEQLGLCIRSHVTGSGLHGCRARAAHWSSIQNLV